MPDPLDLLSDPVPTTVRLFPLPNLVLFPSVAQLMHIFEFRYRDMMRDALASDRCLAIASLEPGWQKNYEGRPAIAPYVCIGRVTTHTELADGRFHLLLVGLQRARIVRELPPDRSYRMAEVQLLHDEYSASGAAARPQLQQRLRSLFCEASPNRGAMETQLDELLGAHAPLGALTDLVAYSLELPREQKLALLAELNVDRRAERLIAELEEDLRRRDTPRRKFPPEASMN